MAFIKNGDGKVLSVVQDEKEEVARKKTAKEQSEKVVKTSSEQSEK